MGNFEEKALDELQEMKKEREREREKKSVAEQVEECIDYKYRIEVKLNQLRQQKQTYEEWTSVLNSKIWLLEDLLK